MAQNVNGRVGMEMDCIESGNLIDAFANLQTKVDAAANWQIQEEFYRAQHTYYSLLDCCSRGIEDSESQKIFVGIQQTLLSIVRRLALLEEINAKPSFAYSMAYKRARKTNLSLSNSLAALETLCPMLDDTFGNKNPRQKVQEHEEDQLLEQYETLQQQLFEHIWTLTSWTQGDREMLVEMLRVPSISDNDKALIVTAAMLSAMNNIETENMMFLFDAYESYCMPARRRAIVAIIFCLHRMRRHAAIYPKILQRLRLMSDSEQFVQDCFCVITQIIHSKHTAEVSQKMSTDILPTLMGAKKSEKKDYKQRLDELIANGENPDWASFDMANPKVEKKMKKMIEMHQDGADIYLSSFRYMKPSQFFNELRHWVCPFSLRSRFCNDIMRKLNPAFRSIFSKLQGALPFCDGDNYSFLFMMQTVSSANLGGLAGQMKGMVDQEAMEHLSSILPEDERAKLTSRNFIFDLYRLFTISRFASEFDNPFDSFSEQNFHAAYSEFRDICQSHPDSHLALGDFLMRKKEYDNALDIYMRFEPQEREDDVNLWQKIAFCHDKQGNHTAEALDAYMKAYRLQPESRWTIEHLLPLLKDKGDTRLVLRLYDQLLESNPDNTKLLRQKGEYLYEHRRYTEAIPIYYKIVYLDDSDTDAKQTLARLQMAAGQADKAERTLSQLLDNSPSNPACCCLYADCLLLAGKSREAYDMYKQAYIVSNYQSENMRVKHLWEDITDFDSTVAKQKYRIIIEAIKHEQ